MQTHRSLESPLTHPLFAHVSRHMDVDTIVAITTSRSLPAVCFGNDHRTLAHTLYWAERNLEDGVNCALCEESLAQHCVGYIPRSLAYFESVRNFDHATIAMIESLPELPAEYLIEEHAKIQSAHQLYWEGRSRTRPAAIEHSV